MKKTIAAVAKIVLVIVLLECSLFNLRYWATLGLPDADLREFTVTLGEAANNAQAVNITDIGMPVRTITLSPDFTEPSIVSTEVRVTYRDENRLITETFRIFNGYKPSFAFNIGAMGRVDSVTITVADMRVVINGFEFNEPLPWVFQWVRVIALTAVCVLIYFWKRYRFSDVAFNPKAKVQKYISGGAVAAYVAVLFLTMFFSANTWAPEEGNFFRWRPPIEWDTHQRVAEALLMGQLHFDVQPHESLLNATQPHSPTYRQENNVSARWDTVFFEGHYYSYFGVVPVLVLYLPYYVITGTHMTNAFATFIFSAMGAVGAAFLWKELTRKYLQNIPYTLYLAGLVCVLFATNLLTAVGSPSKYEIVIAAGFAFAVWGMYFLFRSVRHGKFVKSSLIFLPLGGMFIALSVGCRPTYIFYSFLIPVILWPVLRTYLPLKQLVKDKKALKTLLLNFVVLAVPYAAVGLGLMWYNYARFGSVLEFGASYQLTQENVGVLTDIGALGILRKIFDGLFQYFFSGFSLLPTFPFIQSNRVPVMFGGWFARHSVVGVFAIPVSWFVFTIFHTRKNYAKPAVGLVTAMVAVAVVTAASSPVMAAIYVRYTIDFFLLMIIPALLGMGFLYQRAMQVSGAAAALVRRAGYGVIAVSCFILFGWGIVGSYNNIEGNNPVIMRFFTDLFMIL